MLSSPFRNEAALKLRHGLAHRRRKNASLRDIGEEPVPGWDAGIKRYARWLKRWPMLPIKLQWPRPLVYMHAAAKRRGGFIDD